MLRWTERATLRGRIESAGGRVVDMAGDSVLAVLEAAASADDAALAIQRALDAEGAGETEARRLAPQYVAERLSGTANVRREGPRARYRHFLRVAAGIDGPDVVG